MKQCSSSCKQYIKNRENKYYWNEPVQLVVEQTASLWWTREEDQCCFHLTIFQSTCNIIIIIIIIIIFRPTSTKSPGMKTDRVYNGCNG